MKLKVLMFFSAASLFLPFLFYSTEDARAIRLDSGRSTIQGYVFFDKNRNGVLEYKTEYPGISGVRIGLADERRNIFVAETRTDTKGYYQFYNIRGGHYRVAVIPPRNTRPTNFTDKVVFLPDHTLTTISFGVIPRW